MILIFQPAEEKGNGAKRMIKNGALENVEAIFAVHVSHQHPTGVIGSRPGPLLAGCGFFRAVISGKTGQASNPHHSIDPVLAASAAVISLQSIVSRESNPLDSQVCYLTSNHQAFKFIVSFHVGVVPTNLRASRPSYQKLLLSARQLRHRVTMLV